MLLQMALLHSFLWLSAIPVYVCTHHIFIHSSVSGHLGCFHVLATINSAALNIGEHVSFPVIVFSFSLEIIIECSYNIFFVEFICSITLFIIENVLKSAHYGL